MGTDNPALDRALLFAALSGPFKPSWALAPLISPLQDYPSKVRESAIEETHLAMTATLLAEACDTSPVGTNDRWLMRTQIRQSLLKSLDRAQLIQAVSDRRNSSSDLKIDQTTDSETSDLLAVLLDEPPLSYGLIQEIIGARNDRTQLERIILALDRAGEVAPAASLLQPARAALAELHRIEKINRVAARGFFGRESESAQIAEWLSHPIQAPPVACLFVSGGPGIGKSTLLAESVRRHYEQKRPLILRLDFDRAGLDVTDRLGLSMEATRQLAEQLDSSSDLMDARLQAGTIVESSDKGTLNLRQEMPMTLIAELGKAVTGSGRSVLVVLDTLEVLRSRGDTHPESLFGWLDYLVLQGVKPMHVIAAGRGDALDTLRRTGIPRIDGNNPNGLPARVEPLKLSGLEHDAAVALLSKLEAPPRIWSELLDIAQGNPLKLRLAAEVARRSGVERLPKRKRGSEVNAAFLYRLLLSRIEDPDLKKLAHPGLIVRRISSDVIRHVLAPTLGLGPITQQRADELYLQLTTHHWLVELDSSETGYLKHRTDMRNLLLPLLYSTSPKLSAKVDAAAMRWFAALPQAWAQVEAVYHQLQLVRTGSAPPSVSGQIAYMFDEDTLNELPIAAADLVRSTRGERTSRFRAPEPGSMDWNDDPGLVREILAMVSKRDWAEGERLVQNLISDEGVDARSQVADAVRTFLWRSGQWVQARHWLKELDRFNSSDANLNDLPEPMALARLEMRAEFTPEVLRRRWQSWHPDIERLATAASASTDNCARHGTLALLLANLPSPFHFPTSSREIDLAAVANEIWCNVGERNAQFALERGRERLDRAAPGINQLGLVPAGRVLATLTPYTVFASTSPHLNSRSQVQSAATVAATVIARAGGLVTNSTANLELPKSGSHINWLSDMGLFAEWAEAAGYVLREGNLRLIGRSAERWRRTMAGDWSIGSLPREWLAKRRQEDKGTPSLDETIRERLQALEDGPHPETRALEQLELWGNALGTDALLLLIRQRFPRVLAKALQLNATLPVSGSSEYILRWLLTRGVPAAFAPALTVLIRQHRKL